MLVSGAHGMAERVHQRITGDVLVEGSHGGDDDVGSDVTCRHSTHAVGDGKQPRPGIEGVLVQVSDQTAVALGGIAQGQGHGRNSREVRPIRIGTPRGTGVGPETLPRSRYVPFVEPRSSTNQVPSRGMRRAWRAEAKSSVMTSVESSARPIVIEASPRVMRVPAS